jgi:hypothetical protein
MEHKKLRALSGPFKATTHWSLHVVERVLSEKTYAGLVNMFTLYRAPYTSTCVTRMRRTYKFEHVRICERGGRAHRMAVQYMICYTTLARVRLNGDAQVLIKLGRPRTDRDRTLW